MGDRVHYSLLFIHHQPTSFGNCTRLFTIESSTQLLRAENSYRDTYHHSIIRATHTHIMSKNIEEAQRSGDFAIKPEAATPTLNTADWPLLLKVRNLFITCQSS